MKKLILSLLFAIALITTSNANSNYTRTSEMVVDSASYELVSFSFVGSPVWNSQTNLYTWYINVISNQVGNIYTSRYITDTTFFTFLDTDSQDQIKVKAQAAATNYINTKYPPTK